MLHLTLYYKFSQLFPCTTPGSDGASGMTGLGTLFSELLRLLKAAEMVS